MRSGCRALPGGAKRLDRQSVEGYTSCHETPLWDNDTSSSMKPPANDRGTG